MELYPQMPAHMWSCLSSVSCRLKTNHKLSVSFDLIFDVIKHASHVVKSFTFYDTYLF